MSDASTAIIARVQRVSNQKNEKRIMKLKQDGRCAPKRSASACLVLCLVVYLGLLNLGHCFLYDDSYIVHKLDDRFPYLKLANGSYTGPRDYFDFSNVFQPSKEYYETVNIEELLFEELRAMELSSSIATMDQWHYSSKLDELESGRPESNEHKCQQELQHIARELQLVGERSTDDDGGRDNYEHLFTRGYKNIQLLRYLDAWGRPPSETYHGHSYWVGSYRACIAARLPALGQQPSAGTNSDEIRFGYCWGKLKARDWPERDEIVPATSVRVGLCLPRSCDSQLARKHSATIRRIMDINFAPIHRRRFHRMIDIYCLPNRNSLPAGARLFCLAVCTWISLILAVSFLASMRNGDTNGSQKSLPALLEGLTLQENFKRFTEDDKPPDDRVTATISEPSRIDLRPIGLIRFACCICICVAHCAVTYGWVFNSSSFYLLETKAFFFQFTPSLLKTLEVFMVIGGMLTSYSILNRFPSSKRIGAILRPSTYVGIFLARYLRLAPMFVLTVAFVKSLYPHLADGPFWDYGTYKYSLQGQCQLSSWWRALGLPVALDPRPGKSYMNECLPVSWYLMADLKIALIAPVLIYAMVANSDNTNAGISKLPKLKPMLVAVLISTLWQYKDLSSQRIIYFQQFFTYGQLVGGLMLSLVFGETSYLGAINRLHAFAIGLYAGVVLRRYRKWNITKWPFFMRGLMFKLIVIWQVYDFFSVYLAHYNYLHHNLAPPEETIKLIMVLKPRLDSFMYAIIILRSVTDLAPNLMSSSLPIYKLSKLSYCVYLVHTILIAYAVSSHERARLDSIQLQFVILTTAVVTMSFLISFPLHLLFEAPLANLVKAALGNPSSRRLPSQSASLEAAADSVMKKAVRAS